MCGIVGWLSWTVSPDVTVVDRMAERVAHRGPDAAGMWADGPMALGHRRLSIIDLRDIANQPFVDATGRYVIVYNGEVYNFAEVRNELMERGIVFRTNSDTEVVLEAYKAFGPDCLTRFNGMFAFAVWDAHDQRLFLARDRLGKKPLYYCPLPGGGIVFASELKALLANPNVPARLNPRALSHFLSLNYTHTSEAIVEGVKKLPPAHFMTVERNIPAAETRYWDLAACYGRKRSFTSGEEAAEALTELLEDAVRLRLISDRPLGAFLSGGIDSSAIAAAMCRVGKTAAVQTFSIGFDEPGYDESVDAARAAQWFGIANETGRVDRGLSHSLPRILYAADEPFADTSMIPMFHLAEMTRRRVAVALSGDGGDELFAGYDTYVADKLRRMTAWIPEWVLPPLSRIAHALVPASRDKVSFDYKVKKFLMGHALDPVAAHYSWRQIFTEAEKQALVVPELVTAISTADPLDDHRQFAAEMDGSHPLDIATYVDIKTWLADDILVKVDRATMAHGLEARNPLLDYRLVEFAASLPTDLRLRGFQRKHLLKLSQRGRVPPFVLKRRKAGFNAPISHWFDKGQGTLLDGLDATALAGELFRTDEVNRLLEDHWRRRRDNGLKIFGLLALYHWRREMRI